MHCPKPSKILPTKHLLNFLNSALLKLRNPANNWQELVFDQTLMHLNILLVSWGKKKKSKPLSFTAASLALLCKMNPWGCTRVHGWGTTADAPLWCLHATHLRSTSHMHARHRQGGYVHSDTAVQVQGANEEEEPPACYRPANRQYQSHNWVIPKCSGFTNIQCSL